MTLILFVIILGALIFVHELGHFISAKRAGIRVDEFALGFPPKLLSKKIGETVYSLNLVPFGGYVKIFGEDGLENADLTQTDAEQTRNEEHGIDADSFLSSSPPFQGGDKRGGHAEKATTPPSAPLLGKGGEEKDEQRRFTSKPRWTQAFVLASGVLGNIVFAWLLISITFLTGVPSGAEGRYADEVQNAALTIVSVLPDSPAEKAGLKSGDTVVSLKEGERVFREANAETARTFIGETTGSLTIRYTRGGAEASAEVLPVQGIIAGKPAIGVSLDTVGMVQFGVLRSFYEGALMTWDLLREVTVGLLGFLKQGLLGQADLGAVTGPIGIAGLVGEARVLGLVYLLSFTAFISINLAVINLLPVPALDGGRLLFLAIEGIIRRPIPVRITRALNTAGFILLLLLMVVISYRDVVKLLQ